MECTLSIYNNKWWPSDTNPLEQEQFVGKAVFPWERQFFFPEWSLVPTSLWERGAQVDIGAVNFDQWASGASAQRISLCVCDLLFVPFRGNLMFIKVRFYSTQWGFYSDNRSVTSKRLAQT